MTISSIAHKVIISRMMTLTLLETNSTRTRSVFLRLRSVEITLE